MHRIIHIASNPDDIVLDPFVGPGTTAAVAHKMGRRWIGIEREVATIDTFAIPRLTKVVQGKDPVALPRSQVGESAEATVSCRSRPRCSKLTTASSSSPTR
ncbi:MAG: site-specific DNA-methyltransferase [Acidimicrobiia bacterium]|nr:site-specific DNA-methyltransferase [Acidimicrobiia bacterium]